MVSHFKSCAILSHFKKKKKKSSHFSLPKCRQLVVVCDEILSCSPQALLTNTTQLESVDLVPTSPGDQLVNFKNYYYEDFYYYYYYFECPSEVFNHTDLETDQTYLFLLSHKSCFFLLFFLCAFSVSLRHCLPLLSNSRSLIPYETG